MSVQTAKRAEVPAAASAPARSRLRAASVLVTALTGVVAALAVINMCQGTAEVGGALVWDALTGDAGRTVTSVVFSSRLPRALAGILVGFCLGAAGAALQRVSRNVLVSPDTLAVSNGAYLAVTLTTITGLSLPFIASTAVGLAGGLAAAVLVLALAGRRASPVRLVLAGSALAMGLGSVIYALLLFYPKQAQGLYQWGQGSISQDGFPGLSQTLPLALIGLIGLIALAHRLDALALGDDAARAVGVPVTSTRILVVALACLLAAVSVTLAGPIGFVGLGAPAVVRFLARTSTSLVKARLGIPVAGLTGAALVLGSDVALRALLPADTAVTVPTGTITSLIGGAALITVALSRRNTLRSTTSTERLRLVSRRRFTVITAGTLAALVAITAAAVLLGDATLLGGDVVNFARHQAPPGITFILNTRIPRVLAALLAGAALALSGTLVQAATRNPLAEPGVLGISGGASLGAVSLLTILPAASGWTLSGAAFAGAVAAALLVFGLTARSGFAENRLVLVGIGTSTVTGALVGLVITLTDPANAVKALTWLSGSTYGRTLADTLPVAVMLGVGAVFALCMHSSIDLIALDQDTPRLLGVRLTRQRLALLAVAALLSAVAVAAAGTIVFVGLVAPHAARALVGRRHLRVIPTAILLGACLVALADLVGRWAIAPGQLGAGITTALIGAPYFLYLLIRSRT
ncbi:iron ABC transporter permease [Streptomyces sp. NPDC048171]|uniref:iron ABC transporter permease n=1 Tax=Streptomyces sp. NPDC048171 TaxID=3365504 RepID=UPI003710224C